jgi:hypothetical protein
MSGWPTSTPTPTRRGSSCPHPASAPPSAQSSLGAVTRTVSPRSRRSAPTPDWSRKSANRGWRVVDRQGQGPAATRNALRRSRSGRQSRSPVCREVPPSDGRGPPPRLDDLPPCRHAGHPHRHLHAPGSPTNCATSTAPRSPNPKAAPTSNSATNSTPAGATTRAINSCASGAKRRARSHKSRQALQHPSPLNAC